MVSVRGAVRTMSFPSAMHPRVASESILDYCPVCFDSRMVRYASLRESDGKLAWANAREFTARFQGRAKPSGTNSIATAAPRISVAEAPADPLVPLGCARPIGHEHVGSVQAQDRSQRRLGRRAGTQSTELRRRSRSAAPRLVRSETGKPGRHLRIRRA